MGKIFPLTKKRMITPNLTLNLVNEHPHTLNKFNLESDLPYYRKCLNTEYQKLTVENEVLKYLCLVR